MTGGRWRTMSVRGWFALAAVTTFAIVVVMVLVSVVFLGASEVDSQERLDRAAKVVAAGGDRWHDPAWRESSAAELAADDVSIVLSARGEDLLDDGSTGALVDARDGDRVVRVVEIEGTDPALTAQLPVPLDGDNPVPGLVRATLVIGLAAAAVSVAFGRPFVRSLRAVRRAVHQVGEGDLTVELPASRITEVDDVNTAVRTMSAELDRSLRQQAELEHERRLFVAAVAHDLRTPLFSLRGYLEGLTSGVANTPEMRARYLAIADEKARTLDGLVADLFDYARLEYLDQSPRRERLDLAVLLHDLVDGLRPQASAAGLTVELWPHDHSCPIDADREQLARAVTNLIDNAIRYTPSGGRVDVACGTTTDHVWFTVSDSGPGLDPADLPHLFQPLYRGDSARSATDAGSGLGLAVAQRILVAHDGTLDAGNADQGGAVFRATIPHGTDRRS